MFYRLQVALLEVSSGSVPREEEEMEVVRAGALALWSCSKSKMNKAVRFMHLLRDFRIDLEQTFFLVCFVPGTTKRAQHLYTAFASAVQCLPSRSSDEAQYAESSRPVCSIFFLFFFLLKSRLQSYAKSCPYLNGWLLFSFFPSLSVSLSISISSPDDPSYWCNSKTRSPSQDRQRVAAHPSGRHFARVRLWCEF